MNDSISTRRPFRVGPHYHYGSSSYILKRVYHSEITFSSCAFRYATPVVSHIIMALFIAMEKIPNVSWS